MDSIHHGVEAHRRGLERNLILLVAIRPLWFSTTITIPIIVLYWFAHGQTMKDILYLQALFAIVLTVADFPCGFFADKFSRRSSIIIGSVGILSGTLLYCEGGSFLVFAAGEVAYAIGRSFISGADEALLYDSLLALGRKDEFNKYLRRQAQFELYGCAPMFLLGGYLSIFGLAVPFYAAVLGYAVALTGSCFLTEAPRNIHMVLPGQLQALQRLTKWALFHNSQIGWVMFSAGTLFGLNGLSHWFYQPYFRLCGVESAYFGVIYAVYAMVAGAASSSATRLEHGLGRAKYFALLVLLMALGFMSAAHVSAWWGFVTIFLCQIVRGWSRVAYSGYVNNAASAELRAATLSLKGFVERGIYATLLIAFAFWVDESSVQAAFVTMAWIVGGFGVVMLLLSPQQFRKEGA